MSEESKKKELTREQKLAIEEKAIQALLDMGVKFSVPLKMEIKTQPKRISWWNRHFPNHQIIWHDDRIPKDWDVSIEDIPEADRQNMQTVYLRRFYVKPLYLGTIDRIRAEYLNIEFDEEKIQVAPGAESKKLFKYIPTMAKIAAMAVINDKRVTDPENEDVKELQEFFIEHLTVNTLSRLVSIISQMMNTVGFTNSIRSIVELPQPTKPKQNRVE